VPDGYVLWIYRADKGTVAAHAAGNLSSRDEVVEAGDPVFCCPEPDVIIAEGDYPWKVWDDEGNGSWKDLGPFETKHL
jgi:hypothetical protein